ncbi:MAG TPA: SCO family protein [Thermoanaerobaculia bacterium]|nr:SCO family protein [Thermoanaerobaculia bacterium]
MTRRELALGALLALLVASNLFAQAMEPPPGRIIRADEKPEILKDIGIDQRLDAPLPLDVPLRDEAGRAVRLGDYFGKRPVVFALVYYNCPMLCTQVLNGLVGALNTISLEAGRDFDVVAVSFDARDKPSDAAAKKDAYLTRYKHPNAAQGWHFLTGDPPSIERITKAAGFRFKWDESRSQFAHASAVIVATPDGRLARYFYGIEYSPRDLRLGLVEASAGRIGTPVDQVLLYCFHYDPTSGKYGAVVIRMIRIAGLATIAAIGISLWMMSRRRLKVVRAAGEAR